MTIFPIFENCTRYTLDPFWIGILNNCANNRFPKECYYDSSNHRLVLFESEEDDSDSVIIGLSIDPIELYTQMMHVFKEELGLKSTRDFTSPTKEDSNASLSPEEENVYEWKKIRSKAEKESLLKTFIEDILKENDEIPATRFRELISNLYSQLFFAFQFKTLKSSDVILKGGKISSIKGVEFDEETQSLRFSKSVQTSNSSKTKKETHNNKLLSLIDKFLREYKNMQTKLNL